MDQPRTFVLTINDALDLIDALDGKPEVSAICQRLKAFVNKPPAPLSEPALSEETLKESVQVGSRIQLMLRASGFECDCPGEAVNMLRTLSAWSRQLEHCIGSLDDASTPQAQVELAIFEAFHPLVRATQKELNNRLHALAKQISMNPCISPVLNSSTLAPTPANMMAVPPSQASGNHAKTDVQPVRS